MCIPFFSCQSEKFVIYTIVFGSTKIDFQKIFFLFGVFAVTENVSSPVFVVTENVSSPKIVFLLIIIK